MPAMTLNLPDDEWEALAKVAADKSLSKTVVIRQALNAVAIFQAHQKAGDKIVVEYASGLGRSEVTFL